MQTIASALPFSASPDWADNIPVSVNDTYGDPFIIEQLINTEMKVEVLKTQRRPIAIFTKAPYREDILDGLRRVAQNEMVVPMYSLTGLNEGDIAPENRREMVQAIKEIFGRVVILTRPIIPGRNDDEANLSMLVDVAAETSGIMVLGGIHDKHKRKRIGEGVESILLRMCEAAGVKAFYKSSCCAAYLHGQTCWLHDLGPAQNIEIAHALGYKFSIEGESLVLDSASTGDLNFLRMVTRSEVYARRVVSNYNLLSIETGGQKFESTSSWYAWAKNIDTCIGCNYCIILQIEYLKKNPVSIGTHPREILSHVAQGPGTDFSQFRLTKMPKLSADFRSYADVRVVKPCRKQFYEELDRSAAVSSR